MPTSNGQEIVIKQIARDPKSRLLIVAKINTGCERIVKKIHLRIGYFI